MQNKFLKLGSSLVMTMMLLGASVANAQDNVSMKQTVDAAIAYNPTIKAFQEYRQAAAHDVNRARSDWFPRVDVRAGWGFERYSDPTTRSGYPGVQRSTTYYDRSNASLTVSQTIWDGMATWYRVSLSQHKEVSATNRLYDNAEALTLDALLAHIEIYRQRRIVALAELNVQNHRRILDSQHERQRSGASSLADVTQTQSRLARTEASLAESRAASEVATANYKRVTNIQPLSLDTPSAPVNASPSLEDALAKTHTGNLKIRALQSDVLGAEAQSELSKSGFHPTIYLEAGPGYNNRTGSSDTHTASMDVMLYANWNLFRGGYDWYNVRGDKARARQTKYELQALVDSVVEETTATWSQLVSAQEQVRFFSDAVNYSTKTRNMYLEQFNIGQRSLLDVLDSENEVFTSAIQLVTAQQNVVAAQYRLLALSGSLLANFEVNHTGLAINTSPPN